MSDKPITWNAEQGIPEDYRDLYYYKTDTIFGVVYGDLAFAIVAMRNGVPVVPILNKI